MAGFDDIKDKGGLLSGRGDDMLRRRQERIQQKSKQEIAKTNQIAKDLAELKKISQDMETDFETSLDRMTQLSAAIEESKRARQQILQGRMSGANKDFTQSVKAELSIQQQNRSFSSLYGSSQTYGTAYELSQRHSTPELEQSLMHSQRRVQAQNDRILQTAQNMDAPGAADAFRQQMHMREKSLLDMAQAQRAIEIQKKEGTDLTSIHRRGLDLTRSISSDQDRVQMREDIASGAVKRSEVEKQLFQITEKLITSFSSLDKAVSSNANNSAKLAKEFDETAQQYSRHSNILKEMDKMGVGTSTRFGTVQSYAGPVGQMMQGGASMINAYAGYRQYTDVQSQFLDTSNRMQMGQISNLRYQDTRGAVSGDVSSLRRVLSENYTDSMREAMRVGQAQKDVTSLQYGGAISDATGTALSGIMSLSPVNKFGKAAGSLSRVQGASELASIGSGMAGSVSQAGILDENLGRQISQAQITAERFMQMRQMQDVMSKIDDISGQRAMDTLTSLTVATRGLGVGQVDMGEFGRPTSYRGSGFLGGSRARAVQGGGIVPQTEAHKERNEIERDQRREQANLNLSSEEYSYLQEGRRERAGTRGVLGTIADFADVGPSTSDLIQLGKGSQTPERIAARETERQSGTAAVRAMATQAARAQYNQQQALGLSRDQYRQYSRSMATNKPGLWERLWGSSDSDIQRRISDGAKIEQDGGIKPLSFDEFGQPTEQYLKDLKIGSGQAGQITSFLESNQPRSGAGSSTIRSSSGLVHPTGGVGAVSSHYGHRGSGFHRGIDIGAPAGTPIVSMSDTMVTETGYNSSNGYYARLRDQEREYTYIHMQRPSHLVKGDRVAAGGNIGLVGNTGASRGAHLHLQMRDLQSGQTIDPMSMFDFNAAGGRPSAVSPLTRDTGSGSEMIATQDITGGGHRENVLRSLIAPGQIASFANVGISQDLLPKIIAAGVSGLGKEFAGDPTGTVTRAGELSRAGYLQSPEQYMQLRSQMSSVGGNNEDFERILREAVASGLDSSKNIAEMVNATQQISARSAQAGVQAVAGATDILGRGAQALGHLPENMRIQAALSAAGMIEAESTNKELTLGNVVKEAKLREATGDRASFRERESMRNMSLSQSQEMLRKFQQGEGVGRQFIEENFGISGSTIRNMDDARQVANAIRAGTEINFSGVGVDPRGEKLQARSRQGEALNAEDQKYLQLYRTGTGFNRGISGKAFYAGTDTGREPNEGEIVTRNGGMVGSGERAAGSEGVASAREFKAGVEQFTSALGGMEAIGKTLQTLAETLKPQQSGEQAQDAMNKLTVPISTFSGTMVDLNTEMSVFKSIISEIIVNSRGAKQNTLGGAGGMSVEPPVDTAGDRQ